MQPAYARRLHAIATPERRLLVQQFARFGTVGVAGAAVDIGTVYAAKAAVGLYAAGLLAYFAAVTTTWALNRAWTFAGHGNSDSEMAAPSRWFARGSLLRQWLLFVAASSVGGALNRGTFFVLVTLLPLCAQYPVFAILAGVGAGMFANFNLSRSIVFRPPRVPVLAPQPAAGTATRVAAETPK